jgi:hypothetical protein
VIGQLTSAHRRTANWAALPPAAAVLAGPVISNMTVRAVVSRALGVEMLEPNLTLNLLLSAGCGEGRIIDRPIRCVK